MTIRLGFLTSITHSSALVGLKEGFFTKALGSAATLKPTAFSTGTEEATALLAGQLDAAYVGPNPATRVWAGTWPVLLAIALVLAAWELIHLSGWKKKTSSPVPGRPWPTSGTSCRPAC